MISHCIQLWTLETTWVTMKNPFRPQTATVQPAKSPSPHSHSQAGLLPATSDGGNRVEPGRGDDWPVSMSWGLFEKKITLQKPQKKNSNIKIKGMITCWMISNDNSRFSESMSAFFRQKTNATAVEPLENVAMRTLQRLFVSALFDHPIWKLKIKKWATYPCFNIPRISSDIIDSDASPQLLPASHDVCSWRILTMINYPLVMTNI